MCPAKEKVSVIAFLHARVEWEKGILSYRDVNYGKDDDDDNQKKRWVSANSKGGGTWDPLLPLLASLH